MRRIMRTMSIVMALLMLVSLSAMAKQGNGNAYGHDKNGKSAKVINNYHKFEGKQIRINNKFFNSELPPVIKEGRTLIPVRAVTAALGGRVEWDEDTFIATIFNRDETIKIDFYLDEEDHGDIIIYDWDEDEEVWVERDEVDLDVLPGVIGDRTFVPLRFIAEIFELNVGYDEDSGMIDITEGPILKPYKVEINSIAKMDNDILVNIVLNGYSFIDVDGLELGEDYTTGPAMSVQYDMSVTLLGAYVEDLDEGETSLEFDFKKAGDLVSRDFEIEIDIERDPNIDPDWAKFKGEALAFTMALEGLDFDQLQLKDFAGSDKDWDRVSVRNYEIDGDRLKLEEAYLKGLVEALEDEDESELEFRVVFDDDETDYLEFTIDCEDYINLIKD